MRHALYAAIFGLMFAAMTAALLLAPDAAIAITARIAGTFGCIAISIYLVKQVT